MLRRSSSRFNLPEEDVDTAHPRDIIVKRSERGLIATMTLVPDGDQFDMEKDIEVGDVVAIGSAVKNISVGDTVLYRATHGFPIPNGGAHSHMFKVEYPVSIISITHAVPRGTEDQG